MEKTNSRKAVVRKIIIFLIVILQPLLVCPFALELTASRAQAPAPTPLVFATATPASAFGIPTAVASITADQSSPQTATTTAVETASILTGPECMLGTWQIDHDSVVNYIQQSMIGRGVTTFTPLSASGKMQLEISPDQINALVEDFKIRMGINFIGISNLAEFDVTVDSTGVSNYDASDIYITLTEMNYAVQGNMDFSLASFSMDLNALVDVANSLGFAKNSAPVATAGLESTCNADVMTIVINQYASVIFRRVEP